MNTPSKKVRLVNRLILGKEKPYWTSQLNEFAEHVTKKDVAYVEFGKQDDRGAVSISLYDANHRITRQEHFYEGTKAMLHFVAGYNMSKRGWLDSL